MSQSPSLQRSLLFIFAYYAAFTHPLTSVTEQRLFSFFTFLQNLLEMVDETFCKASLSLSGTAWYRWQVLPWLLWECHCRIVQGKVSNQLCSHQGYSTISPQTNTHIHHLCAHRDSDVEREATPQPLRSGPSSLFLFQLTLFLQLLSVHLFLSAFISPPLKCSLFTITKVWSNSLLSPIHCAKEAGREQSH